MWGCGSPVSGRCSVDSLDGDAVFVGVAGSGAVRFRCGAVWGPLIDLGRCWVLAGRNRLHLTWGGGEMRDDFGGFVAGVWGGVLVFGYGGLWRIVAISVV